MARPRHKPASSRGAQPAKDGDAQRAAPGARASGKVSLPAEPESPGAVPPNPNPGHFQLVARFAPTGDQPRAIRSLVDGVRAGARHQTLLGITGSGKKSYLRQ